MRDEFALRRDSEIRDCKEIGVRCIFGRAGECRGQSVAADQTGAGAGCRRRCYGSLFVQGFQGSPYRDNEAPEAHHGRGGTAYRRTDGKDVIYLILKEIYFIVRQKKKDSEHVQFIN